MAALVQIREWGFAMAEQEYEEGIHAVAAPVLDSAGHPIAAITVTGPAYRLSTERMRTIGPTVAASAREIAVGFDVVGVTDH